MNLGDFTNLCSVFRPQWAGKETNLFVYRKERKRDEAGPTGWKATSSIWWGCVGWRGGGGTEERAGTRKVEAWKGKMMLQLICIRKEVMQTRRVIHCPCLQHHRFLTGFHSLNRFKSSEEFQTISIVLLMPLLRLGQNNALLTLNSAESWERNAGEDQDLSC